MTLDSPALPTSVEHSLEQASSASVWWLALSGGRDSVVLLDVVVRWLKSRTRPELRVIHVDHNLHAHSRRWADFCERLAADRGLPFYCHRVSVDGQADHGLEAAARAARYGAFERVVGHNQVLLQGHHADDQVETIFYRLLRGAGPRGLLGIPECRPLGHGQLVRPLLRVPRQWIDAHAAQYQLAYIDDPSNADDQLDRNYLRHQVLPLIAERWPGYRITVQRAAYLQGLAVKELTREVPGRIEGLFGEPGLLVEGTLAADQRHGVGELTQRLYHWLVADGIVPPSQRRLREFARQVLAASPGRRPLLPLDGQLLLRWRDVIYRCDPDGPKLLGRQPVVVGVPSAGPWGTLSWQPCPTGLPDGSMLHVGTRTEGLMAALPNGRRRSFKKLCQALAIPPWWRDRVPLLWWGEQPVAVASVALLATATQLPGAGATAGYMPIWHPPLDPDSIE